ncbi:MAG: protein translocase subunit SecF [Candidatus Colwellbacteria bacterium]|nr:protein translocase subunit SecF [Candidatus Colwellbacteria bacterium]
MNWVLKHKNYFLIGSIVLILLGSTSVAAFGFKLGIDFTSGSLWQIKIPNTAPADVKDIFQTQLGVEEVGVSYDAETQTYSLTFKEITDTDRQNYLTVLRQRFGEEVESLDFWTISPVVSQELKRKAIWAITLVMLAISLYIAFAFRKVSRPISSWKYGVVTLFTLIHDVAIPAGLFAILGKTIGATVDTNFVVALLFVMGFSVHDTIVVFDRVRENLTLFRDRMKLDEIVNQSILQTLHRSINTTLTLVLVLLAIYFFGPEGIKLFILTILVGTVAGAYSSILVASPLLALWGRKSKN